MKLIKLQNALIKYPGYGVGEWVEFIILYNISRRYTEKSSHYAPGSNQYDRQLIQHNHFITGAHRRLIAIHTNLKADAELRKQSKREGTRSRWWYDINEWEIGVFLGNFC